MKLFDKTGRPFAEIVFNLKVLTMDKKCIVCELDFVWELGSKYCWYCVNNKQILINQYYSKLSNDEVNKIWKN